MDIVKFIGYIASDSIPINFVGHDVIEVILGDESIVVKVSLNEDFFNFFVSHVFSEILGNFFEVKGGEFSLRISK